MTPENMIKLVLILFCALFSPGFEAHVSSYEYNAHIKCVKNPHKPQYGGGIIRNPELNEGSKGWSKFGEAKIERRESKGNKFLVARSRKHSFDSPSQRLYLRNNTLYTFSVWIQVSEGKAPVSALFKTETGYVFAGATMARSKCWSMLKGGLTVKTSGLADLYFETNNTSVDIWIDSLSLQPFTPEEWASHQQQSINQVRKSNVRVQALNKRGKPIRNSTVNIFQQSGSFPIGCAINSNILSNKAYADWFTSKPFKVATFENEMKWYANEPTQGHEDYSVSDSLLNFAKQHNLGVRGHNIFWDDPKFQPSWVGSLSQPDLWNAVNRRIESVMGKYKGEVIGWDVVNENLHFNFFESKLGGTFSKDMYQKANTLGGGTLLFLNDYNTLEESRDGLSSPANYIAKIREIQQSGQNLPLAIGLEGHFSQPNLPYIRSSLDTLGASGLPIWVTEIDVQSGPNQAEYLEQILREVHSHPKVNGIVIWAAWQAGGCYRMCLTDNNFRNLATGDVVDKLLREWGFVRANAATATTDADGFFNASLFHGDYEVNVTYPNTGKVSVTRSLKVDSNKSTKKRLLYVSAD